MTGPDVVADLDAEVTHDAASLSDEAAIADANDRIAEAGLPRHHACGEGVTPSESAETAFNTPMALLGWSAGCAMIWSSLFTVGNFLYGRMGYTYALLAVFVVSSGVLIWIVNKLWK